MLKGSLLCNKSLSWSVAHTGHRHFLFHDMCTPYLAVVPLKKIKHKNKNTYTWPASVRLSAMARRSMLSLNFIGKISYEQSITDPQRLDWNPDHTYNFDSNSAPDRCRISNFVYFFNSKLWVSHLKFSFLIFFLYKLYTYLRLKYTGKWYWYLCVNWELLM